jgi:Ni/Fe-hydrogenase 1 B-type cytochrome subunit
MHKPLKEQHPIPFVLWHWFNLVSMVFLILSGLYIHFPPFGGFMSIARGVHLCAGFIFFIALIIRLVLMFVVEDSITMGSRETKKDIYNWLPQPENRHQFFPMLRYYLFMKKDYPISAKYATMQKISYMFVAVLILIMSYTGFCLWEVTAHWAIFAAGNNLISSLFDAGGAGGVMSMRILHWCIMWVFIAFTGIHAYIASMHGLAAWRMIFLHKEDADAEPHA